jgi:hypothetical protein
MGFAAGGSFVAATTEPIHRPASATSNQAAAAKNNTSQPDEGIWNWITRDAVGFFTLGLVGIAGIQLFLFFWQLVLIRESLDDAKIAADAAKESADAAKEGSRAARESADTDKFSMIASDRAYVHYAGCRWVSHRQNDESPVFWRIRPRWINGGNTPPHGLRIYTHYELLDAQLPADYSFTPQEHPEVPAMLPPKGDIFGSWRDFTGADLVAVKEGRKFLYIWGTARYYDVFPGTPRRVTKFCNTAALVTGDPTLPWEEKTNNMDLGFITYGPHNCADEDCGE